MEHTYTDSKSFYKENRLCEFMEGIKCNSLELYPTCCGHRNCLPDYSYGPAVRTEYTIHYICSGKGIYCINNQIYNVKEHQVFFIPPGIPHYYCSDSDEPWEYLWLGFGGEKAGKYAMLTGLSLDNPVTDLLVPGQLLTEIIGNLLKSRYFSLADELDSIGYVYQFLSLMAESHSVSLPAAAMREQLAHRYAAQAQAFIRQNYQKMTIGDLAAHLKLSRAYVHTLFKKNFSVSPQKYLIRYRLDLAAGLLKSSLNPIHEIALSVGYTDASTYSRAFKRQFGMSPLSYRLNHGNQEQKSKEEYPHGK